MQTRSATPNSRHQREDAHDALHQVLFDWGRRLFSTAGAGHKKIEVDEHCDLMMSAHSSKIGPVTLSNVTLSNWQQQTMTQLTHALMLMLTKHGRDVDAAYVMHLHHIQRDGEISFEQCLDRLMRLCPDEVATLPAPIRAKLACIKEGIH